MRLRSVAAVGLAVGAAAATLTACRPNSVLIAFAPPADARYRYDVTVRAVTRSTLANAVPRRSEDDFVLHSQHRILSVGPKTTEVEVKLEIPGVGTRTFNAAFDRAAELSRIQSIEGVPATALGQLGLSEILPGAAGAPPQHPLSPGDRWAIDSPAAVIGGGGSRLKGEGRLVDLGVVRGRKVATIESRYRLPVKRTTASGEATISLDGSQTTVVRTVRILADGAVESARAVTHATYAVVLTPPPGSSGAPVTGRLVIDVRSTTSRLR